MSRALRDAGIEHGIHWTEKERSRPLSGDPPRETERRMDLIVNYFELPRGSGARSFDMAIGVTDRGIGYFERRRGQALREALNPIHWAARVLRVPLGVLKLAGVESSGTLLEKFYGWALQILVLMALAFGAARLGISLPWDQLTALLR